MTRPEDGGFRAPAKEPQVLCQRLLNKIIQPPQANRKKERSDDSDVSVNARNWIVGGSTSQNKKNCISIFPGSTSGAKG